MIIKVNLDYNNLDYNIIIVFHPERELSVVSAYSVVVIDTIIQGKRQ